MMPNPDEPFCTKAELELAFLKELETAALDWLERRNALSSACSYLGIGPTTADSQKWTDELLRRERPFRKFMETYREQKRYLNDPNYVKPRVIRHDAPNLTSVEDPQSQVRSQNETSDQKKTPAPHEGEGA